MHGGSERSGPITGGVWTGTWIGGCHGTIGSGGAGCFAMRSASILRVSSWAARSRASSRRRRAISAVLLMGGPFILPAVVVACGRRGFGDGEGLAVDAGGKADDGSHVDDRR